MCAKPAYKPTFFDRHGPDGGLYLRALGGGALVLCVSLIGFSFFGLLRPPVIIGCVVASFMIGVVPMSFANSAGWTFKRLLVDGASTPYVEQYSYQQALVMQGRVDDALASFEAIIAERSTAIDARLRAAELYDRERKDFVRAASLFREVQRIATVPPGQFIFATNRLIDLYTGPLNDQGKALVELRRLIETHPTSPAAEHARAALVRMKSAVAKKGV
jgi:hypothetical protein